MTKRVNVGFIGNGKADEVFGGYLNAWAFREYGHPEDWYKEFRSKVLDSLGRRYLPIYRMGDGEFRFIMGRKLNLRKRPLIREIVGYGLDVTGLRRSWKTSWGEGYSPSQMAELRPRLLSLVKQIAGQGYLALFVYDNGIHAFEEYNRFVEPFFMRHEIELNSTNHLPFHFPVNLLVDHRAREFYEGRHIVIATGFTTAQRLTAQRNLMNLGVRRVSFIEVSGTSAMTDRISLVGIEEPVDLCLVAAGIGAANIIAQMAPLGSPTIDVGGFVRCLVEPGFVSHCLFKLPNQVSW